MPKLTTAWLTLFLFAAPAARADTIPMYTVNGDVTLGGNSSCPSCSETLGFSFNFNYNEIGAFQSSLFFPYVSNVQTTWSGNLASGPGTSGSLAQIGPEDYLPFFDSHGDEVDVWLQNSSQGLQITSPSAPMLNYAWLYGCATSTCVNSFVPPYLVYSGSLPLEAIYQPETLSNVQVDSKTVHTPEPSTMAMLGCGLLLLLLVAFQRERQRAASSASQAGSHSDLSA